MSRCRRGRPPGQRVEGDRDCIAEVVREPAEAGPVREGLTVRQPERSEIPVLARLDMALTDHQHLSPCFSSSPLDVYEERVADWEEDFDNPKFWNVVVEHADDSRLAHGRRARSHESGDGLGALPVLRGSSWRERARP